MRGTSVPVTEEASGRICIEFDERRSIVFLNNKIPLLMHFC